MFNLEQAIADWRQKMLACGIETPVPMEELELHLREEMERQMEGGLNPQPAFEAAVEQIGTAGSLTTEFSKINPPLSMKSMIKILTGILAVAIGAAVMMPALAKLNHNFDIPSPLITVLLLSTVVTTVGACVLLQAIAMRLMPSK
jgi:hypothetical protein